MSSSIPKALTEDYQFYWSFIIQETAFGIIVILCYIFLNFIDFCSNFYYSFLSLYLDLMNSSSLDPQDGYRAFFFFNTHVLAAAFYSADFVVCFPFHLLQLLFVCFYWYFSFEQCIFGSVLFNLQVWEDFFFMLPVCWFSVKFKCLKAGIVWFVLF